MIKSIIKTFYHCDNCPRPSPYLYLSHYDGYEPEVFYYCQDCRMVSKKMTLDSKKAVAVKSINSFAATLNLDFWDLLKIAGGSKKPLTYKKISNEELIEFWSNFKILIGWKWLGNAKEFYIFNDYSPVKPQIGGAHYENMKIQPWEIIEKNGLDFFEGNALKYLLRYKEKGGAEDLKKCKHYIDKLIENLK